MSEEETSQEAQVDDEEVDDANEIIPPTSDQVHTEVTEGTQPTGDKNEEDKKDEKTEGTYPSGWNRAEVKVAALTYKSSVLVKGMIKIIYCYR